MNTTHDDNTTTWRQLADQLTADQYAHIEQMEATAPSDPATVADGLLELAREHAQKNLTDAAQFGHLPTPAGARNMHHWEDDGNGSWLRLFSGEVLGIGLNNSGPAANRVDLGVEGVQYADGSITRSVYVYTTAAESTAEQARAVAAMLVEAATELEGLHGTD